MMWPRKRVIYSRDGKSKYLTRYYLIRTRLFSIFLHHIHLPDDSPYLHDHPWSFVAIPLWGRYDEVRPLGLNPASEHTQIATRWPLIPGFRKATDRHHIKWVSRNLWTLFIHGPRKRNWGFWVKPDSWIPWYEHVK